MFLNSIITGLFYITAFSINECFHVGPEALTCTNQMILIHFRHYLDNGGLQGIFGIVGMLISLLFNNATHVVVQEI